MSWSPYSSLLTTSATREMPSRLPLFHDPGDTPGCCSKHCKGQLKAIKDKNYECHPSIFDESTHSMKSSVGRNHIFIVIAITDYFWEINRLVFDYWCLKLCVCFTSGAPALISYLLNITSKFFWVFLIITLQLCLFDLHLFKSLKGRVGIIRILCSIIQTRGFMCLSEVKFWFLSSNSCVCIWWDVYNSAIQRLRRKASALPVESKPKPENSNKNVTALALR